MPNADVAEGVVRPWSVGAGLPGAKTTHPPRNRKWSLGALTLGTKSNLDLEPGEEWHQEVWWWVGMQRRNRDVTGHIGVPV